MTTMNISITDEQAELVDQLVSEYGFANRSELFRTLLRRTSNESNFISTSTWPFVSPPKSRSKILENFKKTKKYSPEFLKDLEEGLELSDYFTK